MAGTWTHIAARAVVRPLIGTPVKPNHLTTLRLLTGLGACALLAVGGRVAPMWASGLWLVSTFLDRADGELARIGDLATEAGHTYDYRVDLIVNSFLFVAAGVGLRHSWLGIWAVPLGVVATSSMLVNWIGGSIHEDLHDTGAKTFGSAWGFDADDGLYLITPLIWFGLMSFVVLGAAIVSSVLAVVKVQRLRARPAN